MLFLKIFFAIHIVFYFLLDMCFSTCICVSMRRWWTILCVKVRMHLFYWKFEKSQHCFPFLVHDIICHIFYFLYFKKNAMLMCLNMFGLIFLKREKRVKPLGAPPPLFLCYFFLFFLIIFIVIMFIFRIRVLLWEWGLGPYLACYFLILSPMLYMPNSYPLSMHAPLFSLLFYFLFLFQLFILFYFIILLHFYFALSPIEKYTAILCL